MPKFCDAQRYMQSRLNGLCRSGAQYGGGSLMEERATPCQWARPVPKTPLVFLSGASGVGLVGECGAQVLSIDAFNGPRASNKRCQMSSNRHSAARGGVQCEAMGLGGGVRRRALLCPGRVGAGCSLGESQGTGWAVPQ